MASSDRDRLVYSLQGDIPAGALIGPATGTFFWGPDYPGLEGSEAGVYTITVRVAKSDDPTRFAERTFTVTVQKVPHVVAALVNDGEDQRSMVDHLTITFDDLVDIDDGAFEVIPRSGDPVNAILKSKSDEGGRTTVVLSLALPGR